MKRKLEESERWLRRSSARIPGRAQTFSKAPISFVQGVAPAFLAREKGAYVWDVDGNRYIDFILGLGPSILGHADDVVNQAVRDQMELGVSFSLPTPIEVELSEKLCEVIPSAEMVRFGKNGSDATAAAVRLSRGYTGRDKVARCGYHGLAGLVHRLDQPESGRSQSGLSADAALPLQQPGRAGGAVRG
jgi:glutamate-1-semialdehyde aminotransferase